MGAWCGLNGGPAVVRCSRWSLRLRRSAGVRADRHRLSACDAGAIRVGGRDVRSAAKKAPQSYEVGEFVRVSSGSAPMITSDARPSIGVTIRTLLQCPYWVLSLAIKAVTG